MKNLRVSNVKMINKITEKQISFDSGFTAHQYYFIYFEPSQLLGEAKTGNFREKPPDYPQAEPSFSHMWAEQGSNPQRWDDEDRNRWSASQLFRYTEPNL